MASPRRISNLVLILVPLDGTHDNRHSIQAAQRACRVAHLLGLLPLSPLLYFASFLSAGELSQEMSKLAWLWYRRADRIWLQFPHEDCITLDTLSYDMLESNGQEAPRINNCRGRRPVYQLHATGDDRVGFVPIPMSRLEVRDFLNSNLTAGLVRGCI